MTDTTNPRVDLDEALEAMRHLSRTSAPDEHVTMKAAMACAEALSLLVDARLAAVKPKPEPERAEPPIGSVALDRNGNECFRTVDGWIRARGGWSLGWATLQELRGPVTVIHRAEP